MIDNSPSMEDEQDNLARSAPSFLNSILDASPADDYHIMVVDTGLSSSSQTSCSTINGVGSCTCSPEPSCCDAICQDPRYSPSTTCNGRNACEPYIPPVCDEALGGARIRSGEQQQCIPGPQRYATSAVPNVSDTFGCMARVGAVGGALERTMEAM